MKTFLLLAFLAFALPAFAQTNTFTYQGVVKDFNGDPANLNSSVVTVTLYGDQYATDTLWYENMLGNSDAGGVMSLTFGSHTLNPLPALPKTMWIGFSINGQPELRPLTQIVSTPYAIQSVIAQKLSTSYVKAIVIDGTVYRDTLAFTTDTNGCLHFKP